MDPIELVCKYSFITNKLRYCGPHDSYIKFLDYIKKPSDELAEEINQHLKRFEGLYPYLELIAKKLDLKPFDYKVIEAYWIGNELLDKFDEEDLKEMILALTKRGLPKSYAEKLALKIPKGMTPHHSFNVIYVGVGKVTGSVEFNIENINNCMIRPGEVIEVKEKTVVVKQKPYVFKENKLVLSKPIEKEIDYLPEFTSLEKGDKVSIHWDFVVEKLREKELENLEKYNQKNIFSLNKSL